MRYALASKGFLNGNIPYNKEVITNTLKDCTGKADMVIFGEAFLQGFYAATFDEAKDDKLALPKTDIIIEEIRSAVKQYSVGVSFGFIEKENELFYSTQITIGPDGIILDLFRRVSPGWKLPDAGERYREGDTFHTFSCHGKQIAVGLCGDLWFDENAEQIRKLHPDLVFWPVYTDYNSNEWNTSIKYEYAEQAAKACEKVLYVNSYCLDKDGEEIAKGGSAFFVNGTIVSEVPSGEENILFVEI